MQTRKDGTRVNKKSLTPDVPREKKTGTYSIPVNARIHYLPPPPPTHPVPVVPIVPSAMKPRALAKTVTIRGDQCDDENWKPYLAAAILQTDGRRAFPTGPLR